MGICLPGVLPQPRFQRALMQSRGGVEASQNDDSVRRNVTENVLNPVLLIRRTRCHPCCRVHCTNFSMVNWRGSGFSVLLIPEVLVQGKIEADCEANDRDG